MKKLVMMLMVLVAMGSTTEVSAQSFLKKLGKKIEETAKRKVENKVERTTEKAMDAVLDGKGTSNNNGNNNADEVYDNGDATAQTQPQKGQSLEMTYAKSDFVPGDEIFFEDDLANEQMGEFPSKWDLIRDYAEVASFAGVKCINVEDGVVIRPLMSDMKNYLPDVFTLEFDFWATEETYGSNRERYEIYFLNEKGNKIHDFQVGGSGWSQWWYDTPDGEDRNGSGPGQNLKPGAWHHLSFSFNKRAIKMYINGVSRSV